MRLTDRTSGAGTRTWPLLALALLATGLVAAAAYAQGAGGQAGGEQAAGALQTVRDLYLNAPVINSIIAALSVAAVGLFVFFLSTVNPRSMVPAEFLDQVTKLTVQGKYEQAADLCRGNRNVFVASIIQRCVENAGKGHSVIMDMIDAEGRRRADIVWNRISYLADVSNVAPMLGLLGTVIGMIRTFLQLPQISGANTADLLSAGIGQAMSTTMFGLGVGILALLFYSIVKARVTRTLAEAEQAVHSIADHIKRDEKS
jgi:biopolymer transport protein ExbB